MMFGANNEPKGRISPAESQSALPPFIAEEGQQVESKDGDDVDRGIIVNANDIPDEALATKKRKKKRPTRPASKRGLDKPTGFEEFHADAPLTPEQYAESREDFNPKIPFVDRILKAIQRFERTRKLAPERRDVFYKYLSYGGVDIGPNMFVGKQDTKEMDKDELATAKAQASISQQMKEAIIDPKSERKPDNQDPEGDKSKLYDPDYLAKYTVDFEGTMRGFLSRQAPNLFAFDTEDRVGFVTTTLERFMDYLLMHDVCPEYGTEILKTRDLCRKAKKELWHCAEAQRHLPGDFNIACSTLFGGTYGLNYDGETYWGPADEEENTFVGFKPEQATQIVGLAIAGAADEDTYLKYLNITTDETAGQSFEIVNSIYDHGFEITKIEKPSSDCMKLYKERSADYRPVGIVYGKFFKNPNAPPEDVTPTEKASLFPDDGDSATDDIPYANQQFTFFIEAEPILSFLRVGTRVEATIHELNCGVWFFDEMVGVFPSFDLWLENEMMLGWKEPRPMAGAPEGVWNMGGLETRKEEIVFAVDDAATATTELHTAESENTGNAHGYGAEEQHEPEDKVVVEDETAEDSDKAY